jgi:CRP/FNR family transcriptional regulator, anaerobic regulatory protein
LTLGIKHKTTLKSLIDKLEKFVKVSDQAKTELAELISKNYSKKGTILLNQGEVCHYLYYLDKGFARGFFYQNGKDITAWFAFDNDIATPFYSFVTRKASFESIEILEDSIWYAISYDNLQYIYQKYPEFNLVGRIFTEKYYVDLMARTMAFQIQSATERYHHLITHQPQLLQRASLGHIASYMGISQETLSRIRTKI